MNTDNSIIYLPSDRNFPTGIYHEAQFHPTEKKYHHEFIGSSMIFQYHATNYNGNHYIPITSVNKHWEKYQPIE